MATYQIRNGDTITMDSSTLTNRAGGTVDLTAAAVYLVVDDWTGVNVFSKSATIDHTTAPATVKYTFVAADTSRSGTFRASWVITYQGGAIETFPTAPDDLLLLVL